MEVGRSSLGIDRPSCYLVLKSDRRAAALDLDYVFGPWLRRRLERTGFAEDIRVRLLTPDETWSPPPPEQPWRFRVPTFFPDDPYPFPFLELTVDNTALLASTRRQQLLELAGGAVLMLTFALSIALAARGVRREVEWAEARNRFAALVSHELRTPVAAIEMYAQILADRMVPEKEAEHLEQLRGASARLSALVQTLLTVGALESGKYAFHLEQVNLNEVVKAAAEGAPVQLELAPDLPAVRADRQALLLILTNLMQNALRYSPDVTLATRPGAFEVRDRGPGVPEDEKIRIFEPYHSQGGVGLGLTLVRLLVEGQGGRVEVRDRPGGGAVFAVSLA
jgi:signal transduction histidine kinase